MFTQCTKSRPLAPNNTDDGNVGRVEQGRFVDSIITRDEAWKRITLFWQRPDPGKVEDNLRASDRDSRQNVSDEGDEIINFLPGAHGLLVRINKNVCRPNENLVLHWVDEDNPSIGVFKKQLPPRQLREELRVVNDDVRPLGATHKFRGATERAVRDVGEGTGCINYHLGANHVSLPGEYVGDLNTTVSRCRRGSVRH